MKTIGIDLGGTKMVAGLVDESGTVLKKVTVGRPVDQAGMVEGPLELAAQLMQADIAAIGLGAAGLVSWPDGRLVWGPNVVGRDVPFKDLLTTRFGLPTVVDNDANLAALAESRVGVARGYRHVLLVTLGTGIGGGNVIDGRIYRGRSFAGEVGHMVIDVGGPRCTCGQRGCWETFASGRRLDQIARDVAAADPAGLTARLAVGGPAAGSHLTEAATQGDPQAAQAVAEMGVWLGIGLASLVALLDPEVIVVGGGAARAGDILLQPARDSIQAALEGSEFRRPTPLLAAGLGQDAGIIGAGLAAAELARG
ncbi:MAG TPA: ROK family protein [Acidimicrobiia bacterium]|nr:ROK family protein [Acidimicrobiia bacterium]